MRHAMLLMIAAMPLCVVAGCSAPNAGRLAAASDAQLQNQSEHLDAAMQHLSEAHDRLAGEADPRGAGEELDAGRDEVEQAVQAGQLLRQDVQKLGQSGSELQRQIDSHCNDWLGPRAIRLRNRLILIGILLSLGAVLLRVGPLFGGPAGGAAIVAGHLLTVFALPLFSVAWKSIVWLAEWVVGLLERIGNDALAAATSSTTQTSIVPGATHAPAGSD